MSTSNSAATSRVHPAWQIEQIYILTGTIVATVLAAFQLFAGTMNWPRWLSPYEACSFNSSASAIGRPIRGHSAIVRRRVMLVTMGACIVSLGWAIDPGGVIHLAEGWSHTAVSLYVWAKGMAANACISIAAVIIFAMASGVSRHVRKEPPAWTAYTLMVAHSLLFVLATVTFVLLLLAPDTFGYATCLFVTVLFTDSLLFVEMLFFTFYGIRLRRAVLTVAIAQEQQQQPLASDPRLLHDSLRRLRAIIVTGMILTIVGLLALLSLRSPDALLKIQYGGSTLGTNPLVFDPERAILDLAQTGALFLGVWYGWTPIPGGLSTVFRCLTCRGWAAVDDVTAFKDDGSSIDTNVSTGSPGARTHTHSIGMTPMNSSNANRPADASVLGSPAVASSPSLK